MIRSWYHQKEKDKLEKRQKELQKKVKKFMHDKNQATTISQPIPDMKKALSEIENGPNKSITFNADYDRLVNSNYKYK